MFFGIFNRERKPRLIGWIGEDAVFEYRGAQYRGSLTVWHETETAKRAPTDIEARLADAVTLERWRKNSNPR